MKYNWARRSPYTLYLNIGEYKLRVVQSIKDGMYRAVIVGNRGIWCGKKHATTVQPRRDAIRQFRKMLKEDMEQYSTFLEK